jgi:predicted nucleic acid-binding protein
VTQVLRRFEQSARLTVARAQEALDDLQALRLIRHGHTSVLSRVWQLRSSLSAYDALYVALAESLDAPLVTMDTRLAKAPGRRAEVIVP